MSNCLCCTCKQLATAHEIARAYRVDKFGPILRVACRPTLSMPAAEGPEPTDGLTYSVLIVAFTRQRDKLDIKSQYVFRHVCRSEPCEHYEDVCS